jgi:clan AA aspartic protease
VIVGSVHDLQAMVDVTFRLPHQSEITIGFVVDTGFAGALTLPHASILALGLPFLQEMTANLADDNNVKADVHVATIFWNGEEKHVAVLAMGTRPLLGTSLLAGQEVMIQFVEDGLLAIDEL